MRIRPLAAAALLAAIALLGTACKEGASPEAASSSPAVPAPTAVPTTGDPAADLAAALERSAKQPTTKVQVTLPTSTTNVQVDRPGELVGLVMTGYSLPGSDNPFGPGPYGIEMVVSGTDIYVKYTSGALADSMKANMHGKEWLKQRLTTATGKRPEHGGYDQFGISEVLASKDLVPPGAKVTREGMVYTVEGSGVGHSPTVLSNFDGREDDSDEPVSIAITVGRDGLVLDIQTVAPEPNQQASMSFRYEPVDIRVPAPDTVLG